MEKYRELLSRISNLERRMFEWDKKKVDDLKAFLSYLYSSLFQIRSFLGLQGEVIARDSPISTPMIPEGSVILVKVGDFEEQKFDHIDNSYYEENFMNGVLSSGNEYKGWDFKESIPLFEDRFPKFTYNRFDSSLPSSETKSLDNIQIVEASTDKKVVFCIPNQLAKKYNLQPYTTVFDTSKRGVEFDIVESDPSSLSFSSQFPITEMRKIGNSTRRVGGNALYNISFPSISTNPVSIWTFDPFSSQIHGITVLKTILWFDPLPS